MQSFANGLHPPCYVLVLQVDASQPHRQAPQLNRHALQVPLHAVPFLRDALQQWSDPGPPGLNGLLLDLGALQLQLEGLQVDLEALQTHL